MVCPITYGDHNKPQHENIYGLPYYRATINQDNPIKTVGRDSFLSPKTPKNTSFRGHPAPRGRTVPIFYGTQLDPDI